MLFKWNWRPKWLQLWNIANIFTLRENITIFLLLWEAELDEAATGDVVSKIVGIGEFPRPKGLALLCFSWRTQHLARRVGVRWEEEMGKGACGWAVVPGGDWSWQKEPRCQFLEVRYMGVRWSLGFADIWTLLCCRGSSIGPRIWWEDGEEWGHQGCITEPTSIGPAFWLSLFDTK